MRERVGVLEAVVVDERQPRFITITVRIAEKSRHFVATRANLELSRDLLGCTVRVYTLGDVAVIVDPA